MEQGSLFRLPGSFRRGSGHVERYGLAPDALTAVVRLYVFSAYAGQTVLEFSRGDDIEHLNCATLGLMTLAITISENRPRILWKSAHV
jgi:hypothetical protein